MTNTITKQAKPLFSLGQTVATPGAISAMENISVSPVSLLSRHYAGDWGDLNKEDQEANNQALENGSRIFSAYQFDDVKFWVITEADQTSTTILLPEEY